MKHPGRLVILLLPFAVSVMLLAACANDSSEIGVDQIAKGPIAPQLAGIIGWINTDPFTLKSLRGKVVLIDFWTYTCVNCIRTLPFLRE
jgi:thiol-disulfide isomerase/thioredoxin